MIWGILTSIFIGVLNTIISLLPLADTDILTAIDSNLTPFKTAIAGANWIFPVPEFFTFVSAVFTIELAFWTYKLIKFLITNLSAGLFKG